MGHDSVSRFPKIGSENGRNLQKHGCNFWLARGNQGNKREYIESSSASDFRPGCMPEGQIHFLPGLTSPGWAPLANQRPEGPTQFPVTCAGLAGLGLLNGQPTGGWHEWQWLFRHFVPVRRVPPFPDDRPSPTSAITLTTIRNYPGAQFLPLPDSQNTAVTF